jgi:hypothetical protein
MSHEDPNACFPGFTFCPDVLWRQLNRCHAWVMWPLAGSDWRLPYLKRQLAVRGRLRRAALHLANSRHQRKRRLPAEFKGFGQRNFIKRKRRKKERCTQPPPGHGVSHDILVTSVMFPFRVSTAPCAGEPRGLGPWRVCMELGPSRVWQRHGCA